MRVQSWPELLDNHVKSHADTEFKWGENDCCTFACNFIKQIINQDPMEDYRGKYKTLKGSLSTQDEYGTIEETMDRKFTSVHVSMARRGDALIYDINGYDALGICGGHYSYFMGVKGITKAPTLDCKLAWRID